MILLPYILKARKSNTMVALSRNFEIQIKVLTLLLAESFQQQFQFYQLVQLAHGK